MRAERDKKFRMNEQVKLDRTQMMQYCSAIISPAHIFAYIQAHLRCGDAHSEADRGNRVEGRVEADRGRCPLQRVELNAALSRATRAAGVVD